MRHMKCNSEIALAKLLFNINIHLYVGYIFRSIIAYRNLTTAKTELSQLCKAVYNIIRSKSAVPIYWIGIEKFGTPLRYVTGCI